MRIPLYFQYIFRKLLSLFLIIHFSVMAAYFCLELLTFSSLPSNSKLLFHFLSLSLSKSDFFITFSFLLTAIHTLQSLKQHGELTALQVSGISKFRLSLPFFTLTLFLALFSCWNTEYGVSTALKWKLKSSHRKKAAHVSPFEVKYLPDQSRLIYQEDGSKIFDLYWIISDKEIWHCKEVIQDNTHLVGHFVDILKQNPLGRFEKSDSFLNYNLPFLFDDCAERFILPEKSPLSKVYVYLTNESLMISVDRAKFLTAFIYKLIHPWFPLIFMTAILAFLLPSKSKNSYFSFLIGIFCYLLFYSMMKTFTILGENYLISPWITVFLVPIGIQGALTYKLCKN